MGDLDLSARYFGLELKNPVLLAPGQLSFNVQQIERACKAGYGAVVLKSVVGEDVKGNASMKKLRRVSPGKWVFDEEGNPVFHWKGGLDTRNLTEYLEFAKKAYETGKSHDVPLIASFLCHLPSSVEEEWNVEEWSHTARELYETGYTHMEIDFCPFLKEDETTKKKETVLRWYREASKLVKEASPEIRVIPKILNLDLGESRKEKMKFQEEMVRAAVEGGADAVTIANRFFVKGYVNRETGEVYDTAHGGKRLREMNQELIRRVRANGIKEPISATGGTYTGQHVFEYLSLGAQNVQVFTYVFYTGLEKAIKNLLWNPEKGLAAILRSKGV